MSEGLVQIGALWVNKAADGSERMIGGEGRIKYLVLPNKYKNKSTHPDYYLYVAQREQKPATDSNNVEDLI